MTSHDTTKPMVMPTMNVATKRRSKLTSLSKIASQYKSCKVKHEKGGKLDEEGDKLKKA